MKKRMGVAFVGLVACLLLAQNAQAAPVQWTSGSGGNDHWYEVIYTGLDSILWEGAGGAKLAAEGQIHNSQTGYLATITSQAENDFIMSLSWADPNAPYWLGGVQDPLGAEPAGGWGWVTGETWAYTNWAGGEPNDISVNEDWLAIYGPIAERPGVWQDEDTVTDGYVVEFNAVPEPGTMALLGIGFGGVAWARRRRAKRG